MSSFDLLIIMAHPDDAELCCSGTILSCIDKGLSVGMIDLTRGELGTRGSGKIRIEEAKNAAILVKKACFLSGLIKVHTKKDNLEQESWRPKSLFYSIQNNYVDPHFVIDVTKYFDTKIDAISCFKSQFYDPNSKETDSFISTKEFMDFIRSRSIEMGHSIGVKHGEGFTSENKLKLTSLENFI